MSREVETLVFWAKWIHRARPHVYAGLRTDCTFCQEARRKRRFYSAVTLHVDGVRLDTGLDTADPAKGPKYP